MQFTYSLQRSDGAAKHCGDFFGACAAPKQEPRPCDECRYRPHALAWPRNRKTKPQPARAPPRVRPGTGSNPGSIGMEFEIDLMLRPREACLIGKVSAHFIGRLAPLDVTSGRERCPVFHPSRSDASSPYGAAFSFAVVIVGRNVYAAP